MSHASSLKTRRKRQKTRKLLGAADKRAKRLAKLALAGPKKEKVKKVRVKKEKVPTEKVEKAKPKPAKEPVDKQETKKSGTGAGKKGAA